MHRPKSSHMAKTCYHHMLFAGGVGFYSKITFLTTVSRSKVMCRSKSCDMFGQGHMSSWPSLVMIGQVMTEVHAQTCLFARKKKKNREKKEQDACLRLVKSRFSYFFFFACLFMTNMLALLFLQFEIILKIDLFDLWPLNNRSDDGVTVDTFACLFMTNMLVLLFL